MTAEERHLRLYQEIRSRICLLDYPPGAKLGEEALAAEFGVSRTPVRRVLARLADEGLVAARHGVGTIVTDVDARELGQVYELRMELAQLAGWLSPLPITERVVTEAQDFVQRGAALAAAPAPRDFATLNMAFFDFGLGLCGNAALAEMSERLYYRTARIWLQTIPALDLAQEAAFFHDEMRQVATALEARDPRAAALIRRAHISMSYQRLAAA
ncbi:GntR family transcriptional regulator [Roseivivax isoporae]|uniref:GntR family transcriptional regulator n=1 Tax=Roseivivax isoporae LMG 25204 TaxID=1449351 RepID=X7F7D6_9RHOB|nr:GntR family transcriptional regulator [Roseivivax isoporae]ETX28001.1 GntR family transcriptional regulator [Roseivivax isoporae LMG 25204]